jgi:hypothetical protein
MIAHWVRMLSCVSLSDPTHSVCACTEYSTVARRSMLLYHGPTAPSSLPYLAYGDLTNNAIVQIATLLGRAVAAPPLPQFPIQTPRVPIEVHPPRVHIPLLPLPKVSSPTVQISKPLPSKNQPALLRVQVPRQSRLQQRRGFSYTGPQAPLLQHMHAIQTFHHHVNHNYNNQGKKETIDTLLAGIDGPTWTNALCNEYG